MKTFAQRLEERNKVFYEQVTSAPLPQSDLHAFFLHFVQFVWVLMFNIYNAGATLLEKAKYLVVVLAVFVCTTTGAQATVNFKDNNDDRALTSTPVLIQESGVTINGTTLKFELWQHQETGGWNNSTYIAHDLYLNGEKIIWQQCSDFCPVKFISVKVIDLKTLEITAATPDGTRTKRFEN